MQSRLYWTAVTYEAIIAQELNLPLSKAQDLQDRVPLPKFVGFQLSTAFNPVATAKEQESEAFYHYHFLSQNAHRIILNRVRNSIYYFST